ncbi:Zn-dependent alcohol dehydrogenase [Nitratireductor mangrovi]|uniref:Zn-dependent alcohol dehydrogenase n=1 Tax=Nitratireductor mangrovi TaxID=2599600 RepID=A0A5B8L2N7_9HYPH|nr:Zn-dependent alcohol dehydrogenase [Nitratireductor mangrovi]QDZ02002.1 Zn-dependent alcohol dehydrogenase [Nitratireductor mangrovi]
MPTARAAVCHAFGQPLTIEEIMLAEPGPGEVLVDIAACAICHSDISYAEGAWGGTLPAVYGHEAAGIVAATGEGVTGTRKGDHVVVTLIRSCGDCHYCRQASRVMCEEVFPLDRNGAISGADGRRYDQSMRTGAFADKVVVHESQLVAIPKDVPFDSASLLACGVITGFGAVVNSARVKPGQSVAVVGCGGVGLNSVQGAVVAGASVIVAIDLTDDKLAAAKTFGATHGVNPAKEDAAARIRELTAGRGVDHVFVTVGAKAAFDRAFDYITKNGTVVVVGMPPSGVFAQYDPGTLAAWNQKIIGSKMGEANIATDIPALVEHYRNGRLKLDELITRRYPLEEINEAIAEVNAGHALRNVIVFEQGNRE